jgi:nitroimidazol reductase NimA-like FMN-containing flavoprotein (pyridoxamine 5'-phosphate oxidase superfamily)
MAGEYEQTERTRVYRKPGRGRYDRELVHSILDEALVCHVGFAQEGQPYVIPTIHAREGETLYLHGANANRTFRVLAGGAPCCLTVTLVDELVLARAALHHSLNYRSVMVLGTAREVTDPEEKQRALRLVVEHIAPGRSEDVRGPSEVDLRSTKSSRWRSRRLPRRCGPVLRSTMRTIWSCRTGPACSRSSWLRAGRSPRLT